MIINYTKNVRFGLTQGDSFFAQQIYEKSYGTNNQIMQK